jgi:hypothetical protein
MTGQLNINKEIRQRKFGWIGLDTQSVRLIVNRARQLCSGTHKVQEQGVGQEIHGDELHWTKVGSTAGVISGLSPGTEKA